MLFKESKKRERQVSKNGKHSEEDSKQDKGMVPAWVDKQANSIKVDISNESRLRKLKKTENEDVIEGADFQKRLKKQHDSIVQSSDLFNWAAVDPTE